MADQRDEEYYARLGDKIVQMKNKNQQRGKLKTIKYIADEKGRGVKMSTRSNTLILTAMELEMQTRAKINVQVKDSEGNKTIREYVSHGFGAGRGAVDLALSPVEQPQVPPPPPPPRDPDLSLLETPTRRHIEVEDGQPGPSRTMQKVMFTDSLTG